MNIENIMPLRLYLIRTVNEEHTTTIKNRMGFTT